MTVVFPNRPCHSLWRRRVGVTAEQRFQNVKRRRHFGPGSRPIGQDPLTGFFMAMRDAWLAGAALKENYDCVIHRRRQSGCRLPASGYWTPMIGMFGAMTDFAAANRQRFDQPRRAGGDSHRRRPGDPLATDFVVPMGHAMMIAANRSASYWLGLLQIFASHQARLAQVVGVNAADGRAPGSSASLRPMNCVHCCARWGTWLSGRRACCRAS